MTPDFSGVVDVLLDVVYLMGRLPKKPFRSVFLTNADQIQIFTSETAGSQSVQSKTKSTFTERSIAKSVSNRNGDQNYNKPKCHILS